MSALAFPLVALALVFFVITPMLTVAVRGLLALRRRFVRRWVDFGSDSLFLLLIAPVAFPLVWLFSSAIHEFEPATALSSCLIEHLDAEQCSDALMLVLFVFVGLSLTVVRQIRLAWPSSSAQRLAPEHRIATRIEAIIAATPSLRSVPIHTVESGIAPLLTLGLWSPHIELDACYVLDNDDEALCAALLHEVAHANRRDPLRFVLGRLFLVLNPVGFLLEADFQRWRQAREAVCDLDAVLGGGAPLALAHAIVRAARFECRHTHGSAALCGFERAPSALRLRVALLTGYSQTTPTSNNRVPSWTLLVAGVLTAALIPHISRLDLISSLHILVESQLIGLGLI